MHDPEVIVVSSLLSSPGRHEARLAALDPKWFTNRALAAFLKVLKRRPMSTAGFSRWISKQDESKTTAAMVGMLPKLEIGKVEDADVDMAAREIADKAKREHMLDRMRWALESLERNKLKKADEIISDLSNEVRGFDVTGEPVVGIADLAEATLLEYEVQKEKGGAYIKSGIDRIDSSLGGGKPGELWLWAGYSSEGKSFSCLNIAYHVWVNGGTVYWIPNEMSKKDVSTLFTVRHSVEMFPDDPLLSRAIRRGTLDAEGVEKHKKVVKDIREREGSKARWNIWKPRRGTSMEGVAGHLESRRHELSVDLLVIDYLEQLSPIKERRAAREELNDTLGCAKEFAGTYNDRRGLWLLSPHQIHRKGREECEKRKPSPHYILSDLGESSQAEQESDVVAWVLRTRKLQASNQILVGVAKARGEEAIPFGFKMAEMYKSASIGNLDSESESVEEADFSEDEVK